MDTRPLYTLRLLTPRLELRLGSLVAGQLVAEPARVERQSARRRTGVFGKRFAVCRIVGSGSWLGRAHQRRGIGTEMRAAVLELAFRGLGALEAESGWLEGNDASRLVSEKLGYREVAMRTQSPRGAPIPEHVVRVTRDEWSSPVPIAIEGLEPCLPLFGVT